MDKQKKTNGILLKRFDLNEADQILTFITEDQGKISLIAKGSRRLKSKFCGRLEPFYHLSLNYFQGRDLSHLNEADIIEVLSPIESDLKSKSILFFIAEVTAKLVPENQECQEIYELLKGCLLHLEEGRSEVLLHAYLIKLLTCLGFMSPWNVCSRSSEKIDLNEPHYFSAKDASIVSSGFAEVSDRSLTPSVIKWVSYMQKEGFEVLQKVTPNHSEKAEVSFIMQSVFSTILSGPLKSQSFLQTASL